MPYYRVLPDRTFQALPKGIKAKYTEHSPSEYNAFKEKQKSGKQGGWTFVDKTKQLNRSKTGIVNVYEYEGYKSSHWGRFDASLMVIGALFCLTYPMWNKEWRATVDALWWGKTKRFITVNFDKEKQVEDAKVLFEVLVKKENEKKKQVTNNPYSECIFGHLDFRWRKDGKLHAQLFGKDGFDLLMQAKNTLKINFQEYATKFDKINEFLEVLRQSHPANLKTLLTATEELNKSPNEEMQEPTDLIERSIHHFQHCLDVHSGRIPPEKINDPLYKSAEKVLAEKKVDHNCRNEISKYPNDSLFDLLKNDNELSEVLLKIPKEERLSIIQTVNRTYFLLDKISGCKKYFRELYLKISVDVPEKDIPSLLSIASELFYENNNCFSSPHGILSFSKLAEGNKRLDFFQTFTPLIMSRRGYSQDNLKKFIEIANANPEVKLFIKNHGSLLNPHLSIYGSTRAVCNILETIFKQTSDPITETDRIEKTARATYILESMVEDKNIPDSIWEKIIPHIHTLEDLKHFKIIFGDLNISVTDAPHISTRFNLSISIDEWKVLIDLVKTCSHPTDSSKHKTELILQIYQLLKTPDAIRRMEIVLPILTDESYRFLLEDPAGVIQNIRRWDIINLGSLFSHGVEFLKDHKNFFYKYAESLRGGEWPAHKSSIWNQFLDRLSRIDEKKHLSVLEGCKKIFSLDSITVKNLANVNFDEIFKALAVRKWDDLDDHPFEVAETCFTENLSLINSISIAIELGKLDKDQRVRAAHLFKIITKGMKASSFSSVAPLNPDKMKFVFFQIKCFMKKNCPEVDEKLHTIFLNPAFQEKILTEVENIFKPLMGDSSDSYNFPRPIDLIWELAQISDDVTRTQVIEIIKTQVTSLSQLSYFESLFGRMKPIEGSFYNQIDFYSKSVPKITAIPSDKMEGALDFAYRFSPFVKRAEDLNKIAQQSVWFLNPKKVLDLMSFVIQDGMPQSGTRLGLNHVGRTFAFLGASTRNPVLGSLPKEIVVMIVNILKQLKDDKYLEISTDYPLPKLVTAD